MQGALSINTIAWYKTKLKPLMSNYGDLDIEQINIKQLREIRAGLASRKELYSDSNYQPPKKGKLSNASIRAHVRAIRRLFKWAFEEGYLSENPAKRLRMPSKDADPRRGISDSDRKAMLNAVKNSPRDYAILMFVWETACRREGVTHLKLDDVNIEEGEAIVREKGKARTVYFHDDTRYALKKYIDIHPGGQDLFMGRSGPLSVWGIYNVFKIAAKKANVTIRWSPHQWRHARARHWLKNGMPLKQVSQLLGHTDISVTSAHYGALAQKDLKAAHKKYS
jgi:integrase/recombinase XerD